MLQCSLLTMLTNTDYNGQLTELSHCLIKLVTSNKYLKSRIEITSEVRLTDKGANSVYEMLHQTISLSPAVKGYPP